MKAVAALVVLLGFGCAACSGGDGNDDADSGSESPSTSAPSAGSTDRPTESPALSLAETEVCDLVRQGIDEFNLGDLEATIERFEEALPLAEDLAEEEPSMLTETLLGAVRYYAELPAEDYVEASTTSRDFLIFKEFTLRECAYPGPPDGATDPAVPA